MGEKQTVEQILDFVPTIDFTTTKKENESVSVFESNIRYLGGMLSGSSQCTTYSCQPTYADMNQATISSLGPSVMVLRTMTKWRFCSSKQNPSQTVSA
jgi:hypothetical protein